MKSIELFAGCGGMMLGTERAGFKTIGAYEMGAIECSTLKANRPNLAVHMGDVRDMDFGHHAGIDLVSGGPPCQPFSQGGRGAGQFDDRDMIPTFIDIVRKVKPRAFIMENVAGLRRAKFDDYRHTILDMFDDAGYRVYSRVMDAVDYGTPQRRKRVFFVGLRRDVDFMLWEFPKPSHTAERLAYDQWFSGFYWDGHGIKMPPRPTRHPKPTADGKAWLTVRDAIKDVPTDDSRRREGIARQYKGHSGSTMDLPSKALKAGVHGCPGGENMIVDWGKNCRYLTIPEARRIQGFPDDYRILGSWSYAMRQLGNSVPPPLAEAVARAVRQVLFLTR